MPNLRPCCAQSAWHAPCYVLKTLNCFLHFVARLNKINMREKYKFGKNSQKIAKFDANLMKINRKTIKMTMLKPTACRILQRALKSSRTCWVVGGHKNYGRGSAGIQWAAVPIRRKQMKHSHVSITTRKESTRVCHYQILWLKDYSVPWHIAPLRYTFGCFILFFLTRTYFGS